MRERPTIEERLAGAGLDAVTASRLAAALAGDTSSFLPGSDGTDPLLVAAVIAAGDPHLVRHALPLLLADLAARDPGPDDFGRGVLWHLRGLAAWRVDGDVAAATRALGRSLELLLEGPDPRAVVYAGRVLDTSGQVLHHQGLLTDARDEFERSLALKEAAGDAAGAALTLGNLGRLCMELGEFGAAAEHLGRDLEHVASTAPGLTRLRSQLLTQLGVCRTELGEGAEAGRLLAASEALAQGGDDPVGLAFAAVHLGRLALREGHVDAAALRADEARTLLPRLPAAVQPDLGALVGRLDAEVAWGRGDRSAARSLFDAAHAAYEAAGRVSPIERAELLEAWARASAEDGDAREAAELLRRALRHLDATTAETMRARLDERMRALDESTWLLHSTGRFVGHGQIELLLGQAGQAGFQGRKEEVTVLFSDIRSFTSISERLEPDVLVAVLNQYLGHMTRCVEHHGGMVDKFIGDAVMALFSLPTTHDDDADRAVAAALHMQAELQRMNRVLPADLPRFETGIGLHTGTVVAGLIGSPQKRSYTVIGDAVNTASRLEGMTKTLGVPILVTAAVVDALVRPARWTFLPFGAFRPKGRAGVVRAFHLAGERDGSAGADALVRRIEAAEEALADFRARRFARARARFETLAADGAGARGYALIARAARAHEDDPPPDDWDGSIELTEK